MLTHRRSLLNVNEQTDKWWLGGNINPANCLMAYQAKYATDLTASKVNMANVGTYDLTNVSITPPLWDIQIGFVHSINQYYVISNGNGKILKPFSAIARIKRNTLTNNRTILGGTNSGCLQWRLDAGHKSEIVNQGVAVIGESTSAVSAEKQILGVTYSSSGVYSFYADGVPDGSGTNNQSITTDTDCVGWAINQGYTGILEYLSIYDIVLTARQIADVGTSINAFDSKHANPANLIVFDGNSMTDPVTSIYPKNTVSLLGTQWATLNFGISGQTTAQMIADAVGQLDYCYETSYIKSVLVCWEGTNDLKLGANATTAYNNLVTYCQARQAAGYKVVILTILPRSDAGTPADFNTSRATVNTNIRNNFATFADVVADVAANTNIGEDGDSENATYYVDKVHMTAAGYNIVAGIVATAVNML